MVHALIAKPKQNKKVRVDFSSDFGHHRRDLLTQALYSGNNCCVLSVYRFFFFFSVLFLPIIVVHFSIPFSVKDAVGDFSICLRTLKSASHQCLSAIFSSISEISLGCSVVAFSSGKNIFKFKSKFLHDIMLFYVIIKNFLSQMVSMT